MIKMNWIIGILVNAVLFIAISGYFSGLHVDNFSSAVIASFILSILNMIVRPLLVLFTLPITFLTLGLFLFVINAITLLLTDNIMGSAFDIAGFGMALFIAVIMALVNLILQVTVFKKINNCSGRKPGNSHSLCSTKCLKRRGEAWLLAVSE